MTSLRANLIEIIQLGSEIGGVLDLPVDHWPEPGQYLACQRLSSFSEILPVSLFAMPGSLDQLTLGPIPADWLPSDQLAYSPPQGHGFSLPISARRVGLVPLQVSPARLLPLADTALAQGAAVALFYASSLSSSMLSWVPSSVEILPVSTLLENPDWPDYLAFDVERATLEQVIDLVDLRTFQCSGDVLVRTPMPCRGLGKCGVCAVHTTRGWKYVCMDGPVFPITEVWHVAR
jgi:hypothetical protein